MHFPFSIATLVAYLKSRDIINKNFKFEKSFIFRDQVNEYINQCKNSDILLCSCYTWNWEITLHLAREVKKLNPSCLIIFGGPQVPNRTEGFFENHPFVDIIVHGEGEFVLANIFEEYLGERNYSKVKGLETKDFRTLPEARIDEDVLPSPYLTNVIWDLVDKNASEKWAVNWETNRGCPYGCTFCDWGAAVFNRTKRYSEERLFKEIEWFAKNELSYIEACDANFGIFSDRDYRIAKKLKETALNTGYPKFFHSAWAKFSSDKIIPIAKELQAGGLLRDVTLAVQSLDEVTLKNVKRANMKFDKFSQLTESFSDVGIPTYTEIIRGLPGETVESFKKGLETMIPTKISAMYIYNCAIYVNAPMNEPSYKEYFKIKTMRSPMYTSHAVMPKNDIPEMEEVVVSTSSFSTEDLKEMFYYSWAVMTLQIFGILDHISAYYNKVHNMKFMTFYEYFLDFCRNSDSIFSKEFNILVDYVNAGFSGKGWNHQEDRLGDLVWPIEEASWLRLTYEKERLSSNVMKFLEFFENKCGYNTPKNLLQDLVNFQTFSLTTRENVKIKSKEFEYDWKNFFVNNKQLKHEKKVYTYKNKVIEADPIQWGYYTIWYGRETQQFKILPEHLQEDNYNELSSNVISKPIGLLSP